jgi:hypothetical protein
MDLRAFQPRNSTYLWRLVLLFTVMWAAHGLYFAVAERQIFSLKMLLIFVVPLVLGGALAFVRELKMQLLLFSVLLAHETWWMVLARL